MSTWDSLINPIEVAETVNYFNEKVGPSRYVSSSTAISVITQAFNYYDYLEGEEKADAIRYDLQSFCDYATTAFNQDNGLEFADRYRALLASGHPRSLRPEKAEVAEWIAGAPELDHRSQAAIVAALSPEAHAETVRHAHIRLALMAQEGLLSFETMSLLEEALTSSN
ncbi:MAG: hypothetical protein EBS38_01310 [Actinobacteria bacterium]|nr:hypothetical protein [Actinomycetota bacterium]